MRFYPGGRALGCSLGPRGTLPSLQAGKYSSCHGGQVGSEQFQKRIFLKGNVSPENGKTNEEEEEENQDLPCEIVNEGMVLCA